MRQCSRGLPLRRDDDTPAMTEAIDALESWNFKPVRPASRFQIKIRDLNYYPDSGSMNFDGQKRERDQGLEALKLLLQETRGRAGAQGDKIEVCFTPPSTP